MIDAPPAGHIKVSRKVFDAEHGDPFWIEPRSFSRWEAWIDLIQLAAWKAGPYRTATGPLQLDRGEFVASLRWMAARWHWSVKRVRNFISTTLKWERLRAQRDTEHGTVYLITKYDAYQAQGHSEGTAKGTPRGTAGAQQGHKIEAVKAVKAVRSKRTVPDAGASGYAALPKETCDSAHARWNAKIGAMAYPRFRKALLPLFLAQPCCYTGEQLVLAVDAFNDGMMADGPEWRGKWTVVRFASELHEWVRLGAMEYVDDYGLPTDRGRLVRIFAA